VKKVIILQIAFVLSLVVFLNACGGNQDDNLFFPPIGGPQVTMAIGAVPNFNSEPILITLTANPADANIFYTLNDTPPATSPDRVPYAVPFSVGPGVDIPHPNILLIQYPPNGIPFEGYIRGHVRLRAIGLKENHHPSFELARDFQIFPNPLAGHTGTDIISGTATGFAYGDYDKTITVTLQVTNGQIGVQNIISDPPITDVHSVEFWSDAVLHAEAFMVTMNSAEFDVRTGSTISSRLIRMAALDALSDLGE